MVANKTAIMQNTSASLQRLQKKKGARKPIKREGISSIRVSSLGISGAEENNGNVLDPFMNTLTNSMGSMNDVNMQTARDKNASQILETEFQDMQVVQDPNVEIRSLKRAPFLKKQYEDVKAENVSRLKKYFPAAQKKVEKTEKA